MLTLKGDLNSIEVQLKNPENFLSKKPTWLCIEVEIQDYLSDLQQRMQTMIEGLNVEVLQLRRSRNRKQQSLTQIEKESLSELTPFDVFKKRLELETFEGKDEQVRLERIQEQFRKIVSEVEHREENS
jgi:exonuclease SbcD